MKPKRVAQYGSLFILPCMLLHTEIEFVKSKIVHYHCPVCGNIIQQKRFFVLYLQSHSSKKTQTKSMKAKKISINIQETIKTTNSFNREVSIEPDCEHDIETKQKVRRQKARDREPCHQCG